MNKSIDYKGDRENDSWEDPCLSCEHYGRTKACCCKTWSDWEWRQLNAALESEEQI